MGNTDVKLTYRNLHPSTPLELRNKPPYCSGFECDLCCRSGEGPTYHCMTCQFNLHPACCTVEPKLRSWAHPHSLTLMPAFHHASSEKRCDGCRNSLADCEWNYRCEVCNFDLQASCAKLREEILTSFHPLLKLLKKSPYPPRRLQCDLCDERMPTDGWVYHCTRSKFDLHPSCVLLRPDPLCSAHPHRLTISAYCTYQSRPTCAVCAWNSAANFASGATNATSTSTPNASYPPCQVPP